MKTPKILKNTLDWYSGEDIEYALKEQAKRIFKDIDNKEFGTYDKIKKKWLGEK